MHKAILKVLISILACFIIISQLPLQPNAAAANTEAVSVEKRVSPSEILIGEEADVELNVSGSGDVNFVKPNDIILIIDRSGSMLPSNNNGEDKMANAKAAAKGFIDLVDFTKHRVGVVDFSSNVKYKELSNNPDELKNYINGIQASGGTNTQSAIEKSRELLRNHRSEAQPVILLLTDGEATEPAPVENARLKALEQANSAKGESVVFYTIALLKANENPATSAPNQLMKEMATTAHHHHFVLGSVGLAEIYQAIVDEIGVASAYDVIITDTVSPEFEIVPNSYQDNIPQPTVIGNKLEWKFNELKEEKLSLHYKIRHKSGAATGSISVGAEEINVTYKDYTGAPHHFNVSHPVIKVSYPAPIISSIVEDNGLINGGETVAINGENFLDNPKVTFGTKDATSVQFIDSTQIIITTPPGVQGITDVKVTNKDGQFATTTYRYFAIPEITDLNPKIGPIGGGNEIKISGKYFMQGAKVKLGENEAVVKSTTSTLISIIAPSSSEPGKVDVQVVNPDGTETVMPNAYEYLEGPVIHDITPSSGLITGGDSVLITGDHFRDGAVVKFNSYTLQAEYVSSTELKVSTPVWSRAEAVNVVVMNPDGQIATLEKGFNYEYPAPIIEKISPNEGLVTGGDLIVIEGQNFLPESKVLFKDKEISPSYLDKNHLRVRSPQWTTEETVDITVKNPDGKLSKLEQAYTYKLPPVFEVSSISPTSGPLEGGNMIYINGKEFSNTLSVYIDNTKIIHSFISNEQLSIRAPKALEAGKVDLKIVDNYQREVILSDAYEYLAPPPLPEPKILKITPNEMVRTSDEFIFIEGENFQNGASVWLNDFKLSSVSFLSPQQLRFRAPTWSQEETVDVKVMNPDGQSHVLNQSLHFTNPAPDPAPAILSLSPDSGEMTGGYFVFINGNHFKQGAKVYFGGTEVTVSFLSNSQLRVRAPLWTAPEAVVLKVINPDGLEGESTFTFTPPALGPAPQITELSPNKAVLTGGEFVYINGENFNAQSVVKFGNQTISASFLSDKQLRVRVPSWPKAETIEVSVTNPDGQLTTSSLEFILPPPPVITKLTPNHMVLDSAELVLLDGNNLQYGVKAFIADKEVTVSYLSDKQIRFRVPIWSNPETVSVRLVNPDGQSITLAEGITFEPKPMKPAPIVTSITPNTGLKDSNMFVYVNGDNFVEGAKVSVDNSTPVLTSFLSSKQLRFRLPISSKTGPVDVKVINPDGQFIIITQGFTYQ
ncbi:IPT/TIG domain-containing protein [Paenibacillus sp. JZ16]|uniref:IPT/TIG domain-containing protein n=1 Tax=Paenibacillus sp. JZ16 TaxID=1906272 RepID=UPI00188B6A22|nr:IPT/TIG domain-containing protein [Paenibacillus sp. JZ16]